MLPTMRRGLAIGGGALGLALIGYALFAGESDDELIQARLTQLEQAVQVDGQENAVMRGARVNKHFKEIFEKDVVVRIPELTSLAKGRQGLSAVATKAGTYFQSAEVDFDDVEIQIDGSKVGALVIASAQLDAVQGGRPRRDQRRVTLRFSKNDGEWQIASINVAPKGDDATDAVLDEEPEEE